MEVLLYGPEIAVLLRETPFTISVRTNLNLTFSKDSELSWFNETVKELVQRLHSFSKQCIVSHINKIPGHCRPTYNYNATHNKILNSLVDHVLRRVSYLFSLKIAPICEVVLAHDPHIVFEDEPSKEVLINNVIRFEYGAEVLHCLSTPSLGGNEQRQLREKLNRRREKDAMIQRVKEDYKNADKESGTRRFTPLMISHGIQYRGTIVQFNISVGQYRFDCGSSNRIFQIL